MQRSISMALAVTLAVGTAVATLGSAQGAPVRATLPVIETESTAGIQAVHDRRHGQWHRRHHRHHPRRHLRFGFYPFFSFSVPHTSPRYERDFRPYRYQRQRPYWQHPGWER